MKTFGTLKLYEIPDIAEALGIHPVTARRYLKEGRIPGRKEGKNWLVTEEAMLTYFQTGSAAPGAGDSTGSKQ